MLAGLNIIWLLIRMITILYQGSNMQIDSGLYFGAEPPGLVPEIFAPGIISTDKHEFSCTFSLDMDEFYFARGMNIWFSRRTDDGWSQPELASFCSDQQDNEPHILPDNRTLLFGSKRVHSDTLNSSEYGIWISERENSAWGIPEYVGAAAFISSTFEGTIYTRRILPDYRSGTIVRTKILNGRFAEMLDQSGGVIAPQEGFLQGVHPSISPDGRYMVFIGMKGEWGRSPDLFVSFNLGNEKWSRARNLSDVLGMHNIFTPYISPDGKILFFSYNHDIYWVSTDIIRKKCIRPDDV